MLSFRLPFLNQSSKQTLKIKFCDKIEKEENVSKLQKEVWKSNGSWRPVQENKFGSNWKRQLCCRVRIYYHGMPTQCSNCMKLGHLQKQCTNNKSTWKDFVKSLVESGNFEKDLFGSWLEEPKPSTSTQGSAAVEMKKLLDSNSDLRKLISLMKETKTDLGGASKPKRGRPKSKKNKWSGGIVGVVLGQILRSFNTTVPLLIQYSLVHTLFSGKMSRLCCYIRNDTDFALTKAGDEGCEYTCVESKNVRAIGIYRPFTYFNGLSMDANFELLEFWTLILRRFAIRLFAICRFAICCFAIHKQVCHKPIRHTTSSHAYDERARARSYVDDDDFIANLT